MNGVPLLDRLQQWALRQLANRLVMAAGSHPRVAATRAAWWARQKADPRAIEIGGSRFQRHLDYLAHRAQVEHLELYARGGQMPERRSVPFPAVNQLGVGKTGFRALPKPSPVNLRRFSEVPPAHRAISKVKSMIAPLEWKVQPKKGVLEKGQKPSGEMQNRIDAAERAFARPNNDDSWQMLLEKTVEDILVGGCGSIEFQPWKGNRERPFVLYPIDGLSIRINFHWTQDDDEDPENAYRYLQAYPYGGGGAAAIDCNEHRFADKELIYFRFRPRTHTPFGFGSLEAAFNAINAWLGHMDYQERMRSNDLPPFGIWLGEKADPDYVDMWRAFWFNDVEGYGQVPIWGGGTKPETIDFKEKIAEAKDVWYEELTRICAMCFDLPAQSLNLEKDVNRSTSEVAQSSEFTDAALPRIAILEDGFTRGVFEKGLGWFDLELKCIVVQGDKLQQAQVADVKVRNNTLLIDEAREEDGKEPLPNGQGQMTFAQHEALAQAGALSPMNELNDRLSLEDDPTAGEHPTGERLPKLPTGNGHDAALQGVREHVLDAIRAGRADDDVVEIPVTDAKTAAALRAALAEPIGHA